MIKEKIFSVPTNIITGFLGVGKTSAILHLLKQKPENERWAVLVNEFGEIGVDASLIKGCIGDNKNIFIREVPGGCMCCASGVPMRITLNQLLAEAKPHRLLIEPTGLGHPTEVLHILSNQYYQDVLQIEKTITLVDARNLNDQRYIEHEIFNQQLQIADIIVGTKADLYTPKDKALLSNYLQTKAFTPEQVSFIANGKLQLPLLFGSTHYKMTLKTCHIEHKNTKTVSPSPLLKEDYSQATNQGEGFKSIGWRFAPHKIFDREKLHSFLMSVNAIRIKAVFITPDGTFGYNTAEDNLIEIKLDECNESRIEIICDKVIDSWQTNLLKTLLEEQSGY